jgi:hypothetical protein
MRFGACSREREVNQLLGRGQWPQACPGELRDHVAGCRSCREVVLVRQAFARERSGAFAEARLESPGALWWRAQLRRRNVALERIGRPLMGAQIFALSVCLTAAVVYVLWLARRGFDWLAWAGEVPRALHIGSLLPAAWLSSSWGLWMGVSMAVMVALTGGLIAFLGSEKR